MQPHLGCVLGVRRPEGQFLEADGARELDARLVARAEVEVQPDVRVVAVLRSTNDDIAMLSRWLPGGGLLGRGVTSADGG